MLTVLERLRELTGIYSLGFAKESMIGVLLPIAFVVLIGGIGAALVLLL